MVEHAIPKVTIAIPTLNRVEYLRLALHSALAQTYAHIEVIVSNNASTDETFTYLNSIGDPRLRVLNQQITLPMTENWNACLAAATGEYFLLLSDDDLLESDAIRELISPYAQVSKDPPPGIVYCGGCVIDSGGEVTRILRPSPAREAARDLITAFFQGERELRFCGVLLRTDDVRPGFPSSLKMACDAAVWMRAAMRYDAAIYIPKSLMRYRLHSSISFTSHFDVWREDNQHLLELVILQDTETGRPDPKFASRLRSIVRRVDRNIVIGNINHLFRQSKGRALLEYGQRLNAFLSPVGLMFLAKGITSLFLSDGSRAWLKKILRKRPAFE